MIQQRFQHIKGGHIEDDRGKVSFVNEFNLTPVVRFYKINHPSRDVIRAWQGHKFECKWFHCIQGCFEFKLIEIDDWNLPSKNLNIHELELNASDGGVLFVPGGYANGFRALDENSSLLVFSNYELDRSKLDDFRFEHDYWHQAWID